MKKIAAFLVLFMTTLLAMAQQDSTVVVAKPAYPDTVGVTLHAHQYALIIQLMGEKADVDRFRMIRDVSDAINTDSTGKIKDEAQLITVFVPVYLIGQLYVEIGSNQERYVGGPNRAIQKRLFDDFKSRRPDVIAMLGAITELNSKETDRYIVSGFKYLLNLKK